MQPRRAFLKCAAAGASALSFVAPGIAAASVNIDPRWASARHAIANGEIGALRYVGIPLRNAHAESAYRAALMGALYATGTPELQRVSALGVWPGSGAGALLLEVETRAACSIALSGAPGIVGARPVIRGSKGSLQFGDTKLTMLDANDEVLREVSVPAAFFGGGPAIDATDAAKLDRAVARALDAARTACQTQRAVTI